MTYEKLQWGVTVVVLGVFLAASGNAQPPQQTQLLGALSTSAVIFLILEMNTPLDGVIGISLVGDARTLTRWPGAPSSLTVSGGCPVRKLDQ